MILVNGFHVFTIITKHSILDVVADLDPPLRLAFLLYVIQVNILHKINASCPSLFRDGNWDHGR